MNIYKQHYMTYLHKGLVTIPDKFGSKIPMIKGWNRFFSETPSQTELDEWCAVDQANISLLLGKKNGIIALDVDTDKPEILKAIEHLLPESPLEKRGSKGYTRFFKFAGDNTELLKFNGEVILEILSDNKKTTLPPSLHPNGANYVWTKGDLAKTNISDLPVLPPSLIAHLTMVLKQKFGDVQSYGKVTNGRHNDLSSFVGRLVDDNISLEESVKLLIKEDKDKNETPYFTDPDEHQTTDAVTNATLFYAQHLQSFNSKRYRDSKEYVGPKGLDTAPKSQALLREKGQKQQRRCPTEYLPVNSVLKSVYETILQNSHIPQPELAMGATLAMFSVLTARKFSFRNMSSNLYICNVSESGTGKDAPQQLIKNWLGEAGADNLLGSGDYVSDASLMDSLTTRPVRLDVLDEVGGMLKGISSSGAGYASKMADIMTELYTCSNQYYMGRTLANDMKGQMVQKGRSYRPNVVILGSTTPTGFSEGISTKSLEKGLLGRFLLFRGDPYARAVQVTKQISLKTEDINHLRYLASYVPKENLKYKIKGIPQEVTELNISPEAEAELTKLFNDFEKRRLKNVNTKYSPIVCRLFQLALKMIIISACSRQSRSIGNVDMVDIEFARNICEMYFNDLKDNVCDMIYGSSRERAREKVRGLIKGDGVVSYTKIALGTPEMSQAFRKELLDDMLKCDMIEVSTERNGSGKMVETFYYKGE